MRPLHRNSLGAALVSLVLTACGEPCVALTERICGCYPNRLERDACNRQASAMQQSISSAESEQCSALLDSCTCEALERKDLAACGLAKPAG